MKVREFSGIIVVLLLLGGVCGNASAATYTTSFLLTENPMSEGGKWINGGTTGIDWHDFQTANQTAYGPGGFNTADSTAILTGSWGSNQTASAKVFIQDQGTSSPEIELRLRSTLSAHSCTGYEINYSCMNNSSCYIAVVSWNGKLGDFTVLGGVSGIQYVLTNGSTLKASIIGSTITVYLNDAVVYTMVDTKWPTGNPGIGTDQSGSKNGFTSFMATDVTDVVNPPAITAQPQSQSIDLNSNAAFQVSASGTEPLTYQWYFNGTNAIASGTNSQLSLINVLAELAGNYNVVVSNPAGSVTSTVALLTVILPQLTVPVINTQPKSQGAAVGSDVSFDVAADGTPPLLYQWFFNGNLMLLENASTLRLSQVQPSDVGGYNVVVANLFGSVTSAVAQLTLLFPPSITNQPSDQTAVAGGTVSFQSGADGSAPLSYQWSFGGSAIAGATGPLLNLTNVQANQAGGYSVVATNFAGAATSVVARLTVLMPPAIRTQPTNQTVVLGGNTAFYVDSAGSAPLSYQWFLGGSTIAGATANVLNLTNVQSGQAGGYSLAVANSVGAVTSVVALLTVLVPPTIATQPTNQTVVPGGTATFQVTAGGSAPFSYQWWFGSAGLPAQTNSNLVLSNVQAGQAGPYSVVITNGSGSVTSVVAQLTVLAPLTLKAGFDLNGSGALRLSGNGVPNQNYLFQFIDDFARPSWQPLSMVTADVSGTFVFVDPTTNAPKSRFYRVAPQ
jgi:hypothetical protein